MQEIYLRGNKGGDYIVIKQKKSQVKSSCLNIEVGHCCVVILRAQIPTEFLTSLISRFMMTNPDGNSRSTEDNFKDFAKEVMNYGNDEFVKERLSKIQEYSFWGECKD